MNKNLYKFLADKDFIADEFIALDTSHTALALDKRTLEHLTEVSELKLQVTLLAGMLKPTIESTSVLEGTFIQALYEELSHYAYTYTLKNSGDTDLIRIAFKTGKLLKEASIDFVQFMRGRFKQENSNLVLDWVDTSQVFRIVSLCALLLLD